MIRQFTLMIGGFCGVLAGAGPVRGEPPDYLRQIKPILRERCYACHGALKQRAGLRLDSGAAIRLGGKTGTAVLAGKAAESLLVERISQADEGMRMPPEGKPLTAEQIRLIAEWIDAGALSPADELPEPDPRKHWAFQPPVRSPLPDAAQLGVHAAAVRNPIDAFIASDQVRSGIVPQPAAPKEILLRRVTLDLIGLPPTRGDLHAFLTDESPDAYERVVEQLLARPQYGERWARHWMDVWRYSDWYGRRGVNDVRNSAPHIWRWRDWIVRSLNQDKGYDRMLREMLAADEIAPEDDETIAATGFLVRNWYSLNYDQWMRDLVEHTSKAFLGLRLNCALCHDHKYDPISQEEYFRFRAFFEPLEFRNDRVPGGPSLAKYIKYNPGSGASFAPFTAGLSRIYEENLDARTFLYRGGDARDKVEGKPPVDPGVPAVLGGELRPIVAIELPLTAWYPGMKPFAQREEAATLQADIATAESGLAQARKELATLSDGSAAGTGGAAAVPPDVTLPQKQEIARLNVRAQEALLVNALAQAESLRARLAADNARHAATAAPASADLQPLEQNACHADRFATLAAARTALATAEKSLAEMRLKAADPKAQPAVTKAQQQVTAAQAALAAAEKQFAGTDDRAYASFGPQYPRKSTGRRRALADWITDRRNPLAARVAVNHVWMRHIGRPLVATVTDFGRGGAAPTDPNLFDWLAVEFMESGWSMKHLHRLIVTSQAYRRSSASVPANDPRFALDKDNRTYWRAEPRRIEAEAIRDSLLLVSGRLDPTSGGPDLDPNTASNSGRRSLYFTVHPEDGGAIPFAQSFDAADPTDCYRRSDSVLPQQALALTNSDQVLDLSRGLAVALSREVDPAGAAIAGDAQNPAFVRAAFEQILSRSPKPLEEAACLDFLIKQRAIFVAPDPKIATPPATPAAGSSAGPAATVAAPVPFSPELRAREGLIRALFNHTDFLTVR